MMPTKRKLGKKKPWGGCQFRGENAPNPGPDANEEQSRKKSVPGFSGTAAREVLTKTTWKGIKSTNPENGRYKGGRGPLIALKQKARLLNLHGDIMGRRGWDTGANVQGKSRASDPLC